MLRAVVGFGANLGDRLTTLRAASTRLAQRAEEGGARGAHPSNLSLAQRAEEGGARGAHPSNLTLAQRIVRTSHVYATAPVGGPEQPEYLNAAALVSWPQSPEELLATLLDIEALLGRVRGDERFGPRTIDLDLLWIDGLAVASPTLVVPHPRLTERAFALAPMLELVPDARDPRTGRPYAIPPGDIRRLEELL
jgi:2-amino-4-hydroxy-6-hydroxymethyldihydropteridine diphosphokinase